MKYFVFALLILVSCREAPTASSTISYPDHIGDTPYDPDYDDPNFTFCDSTNVQHSRSRIAYRGGYRALEEEFDKAYKKMDIDNSFSGYFFIRFAVNCKNETGRFRWQIVDNNNQKTLCPKNLEENIITIAKNLNGWNAVSYNGKPLDGYTFLIVKIQNGQYVKS